MITAPMRFVALSSVALVTLLMLALGIAHAAPLAALNPDVIALEPTGFSNVVALITGLAWPVTVLVLVYAYRTTLKQILRVLEQRIAKGDKFTALGISVEAAAPLPLATTSSEQEPATTDAVVEVLGLSTGTNVLVALGETARSADGPALIGAGDALALALVQSVLLRVEGVGVTAAAIRKAENSANQLLERYSHAVGIGGPFANYLSDAIMNGAHLGFEFKGGGVHDRLEQTLYPPEFSNEGMDGTDWALLAFLDNPRQRGGRVAVVAGCSAYGTNAAAAVFARMGDFTGLRQSGSFEALIRVRITRGVVGSPEVIKVRKV